MRLRHVFLAAAGCVAVAAVLGLPAFAQATPEMYLELLRSDVRAARVEILTDALELSDAEGTVFWPIFREYDTELMKLGDRRLALIKSFVASLASATDEQISSFAKESFALQSKRLKLRRKYHGKVTKAVSPKVAARFIQVENVMGMMIDIQVAAELPLVE